MLCTRMLPVNGGCPAKANVVVDEVVGLKNMNMVWLGAGSIEGLTLAMDSRRKKIGSLLAANACSRCWRFLMSHEA